MPSQEHCGSKMEAENAEEEGQEEPAFDYDQAVARVRHQRQNPAAVVAAPERLEARVAELAASPEVQQANAEIFRKMPVDRQNVLRGRNLELHRRLLQDIAYPDVGIIDEVIENREVVEDGPIRAA